jgi:hypothetical protein
MQIFQFNLLNQHTLASSIMQQARVFTIALKPSDGRLSKEAKPFYSTRRSYQQQIVLSMISHLQSRSTLIGRVRASSRNILHY